MQIDKLDDTSRILIVSQSHTAVDNIIEGLIEMNSGQWNIIRIGRTENISAKVEEKFGVALEPEVKRLGVF